MHRYVYAATSRQEIGDLHDERLSRFTERHRIALTAGASAGWANPAEVMRSHSADGVVLEMVHGWPHWIHLKCARAVLRSGGRVYFYWPREEAIECIDDERLQSYWALWLFVQGTFLYSNSKRKLRSILRSCIPAGLRARLGFHYHRLRDRRLTSSCIQEVAQIEDHVSPNAMKLDWAPSENAKLPGTGVYFRTDFWAKITSGGSYGHTCFVAKELAASSEHFVAFMAQRYTMLDDMNVRQTVLPPPGERGDEYTILSASRHYYDHMRAQLRDLKPRYIYERICLGNYVGARLSCELGIPYIVEYNGSEISMMRSFSRRRFVHENVYLAAEMAAFRQATAISVISDAVREDLLKRGIEPTKILVNPNGVDVDTYSPPDQVRRLALRRELGFGPEHRVICFTGTFGGWHGVDVLAAAIPQVLNAVPNARFLLIGDGSFKHLVDDAIKANHLDSQVKCVGRVPQLEGARLLGAADVYVSPHASHMVDSRFFGSPTKIFEYMAMGGGIVASKLEQIGEVLSPGLDARRLSAVPAKIGAERALLCEPGNVAQFVASVIYAARFPEVSSALGRNARAAAIDEYSWRRHVERLWQFVYERGL